jgi:hypothetical protein
VQYRSLKNPGQQQQLAQYHERGSTFNQNYSQRTRQEDIQSDEEQMEGGEKEEGKIQT